MGAEDKTQKRISALFVLTMLPTVLVMILSHVLSDSPDSWQRVLSLIGCGLWGLWGIAWTPILLKVTSAERGRMLRWPALSVTLLAAVQGTIHALVEVPWLADSSIELKGFAVSVQLATSCAGLTAVGRATRYREDASATWIACPGSGPARRVAPA